MTLLEFATELRADAVLQRKLNSLPNVTVIKNAQTTEVIGDDKKVQGLIYKDRGTEAVHTLPLEGVFVHVDRLTESGVGTRSLRVLSPQGEELPLYVLGQRGTARWSEESLPNAVLGPFPWSTVTVEVERADGQRLTREVSDR